MDGINQFFRENIIPEVMVPNGVQQELLRDCLETIFLHLTRAHESEDNLERERIYDYIVREFDDLPVQYRHFIDDFNKFLITQTLNGAF
jgi:hypothetical protein